MSLDNAFRASVYVNLALACACLAFAEWIFLPECAALAGVVALLLVVVYRSRSRLAVTTGRANVIGLGIVAAAVVYYGLQPFRGTGPGDLLPFPANLLPYLGPLLLVLVPAKAILTRDDDDYWALLGIGLSAAALASALATDAAAALLVVAYLVSGVWALTLFGLRRADPADPRWRRLVWPAARWSALGLGVSAVLFLLSPRFGEARWELPYTNRFRIQTGFQAEAPGIDLTRSGTQEVSEEVVFEVQAADRAGKPVILSSAQRWRTESVYEYNNGRLTNQRNRPRLAPPTDTRAAGAAAATDGPVLGPAAAPSPPAVFGPSAAPNLPGKMSMVQAHQAPAATGPVAGGAPPPAGADFVRPAPPPPPRRTAPGPLPDLGPGEIVLSFKLRTKVNSSQVLAEPLVFGPDQSVPVVTVARDRTYPWEVLSDGQPITPLPFQNGPVHFRQVTVPWPDDAPGPPVTLTRDFYTLLRQPSKLPRLQEWTQNLLAELVASGGLPAEARGSRHVDDEVRVARALAGHLAGGGYTYTLSLQRRHPRMDPVEEFLFETREGNCERFAAALMLMLRSQRIPAQVVLGYQGCEEQGDGLHDVRESHAHSWVEVFLADEGSEAGDGPVTGRWLPLDATPGGGPVVEDESLASRWAQLTAWFQTYIVNSTPEQRERAMAAVGDWLLSAWQSVRAEATGPRWWRFWLVAAVAVAAPVAARRAWRRWRQAPAGGAALVEFQARLVALLARAGFRAGDGQTALEFATGVGQSFRADPGLGRVADVPEAVTAEYYRHRFGGQELSDPERQAVGARLDDLEAALAGRPS